MKVILYKDNYFVEVLAYKTKRIAELKADGWVEQHPATVEVEAPTAPAPTEVVSDDAKEPVKGPTRKGKAPSPTEAD